MYSSKKGEENEIKYKSDIEKIVKCNLDLTTKFHTFDYENKDEKILVELKCRNCFKNNYPTTMIGMNKINKSKIKLDEGYKIFYFFHFKDGLYYIEYNNQLKYEINDGFRYDRIETIINKPKYAYIDVDNLIKC
tara:strand:- start:211 stop:612 length:402 start_codon:yes stop_codon:yes gene_type:complete